MNVKRFKKILAMYVVLFVVACTFIPFNVTFHATQTVTGKELNQDEYIEQGLFYNFVGIPKYQNDVPGKDGVNYYKGDFIFQPNILMLISELAALTVVFAGVSYITCKRA